MRTSLTLAIMAAAGASAQDSLCSKYTGLLFADAGGDTPANQYMLLQLLVNRVVTGNTTNTTGDVVVPGILAKGEHMGKEVNLLPYFDGTLESTNRQNMAVSVNFLDGGAAEPLTADPPMPANNEDSNQYTLLTHLYSFFGALLMCNVGEDGFPSYEGRTSMEAAHRFMALTPEENGYFITQVGLAAASFGVEQADVEAVGNALINGFNYRCSPPAAVVGDEPELQAICQADSCPLATPSPVCSAYPNNAVVTTPTPVSSGGAGMPTVSMTSGSASEPTNTGAASALSINAGAALFGFAAVLAL